MVLLVGSKFVFLMKTFFSDPPTPPWPLGLPLPPLKVWEVFGTSVLWGRKRLQTISLSVVFRIFYQDTCFQMKSYPEIQSNCESRAARVELDSTETFERFINAMMRNLSLRGVT